MGTNYYLRGHLFDDSPDFHIGKKSAAGLYCWDCGLTLCKAGGYGIHQGRGADDWHKICPKCHKAPTEENLAQSAAGRELGFNKGPYQRKTGVASCSSFRWAMKPSAFENARAKPRLFCPCCNAPFEAPEKFIENEYGELFTLEEFEAILKECPVVFLDSVGTQFS